MAYAEPNDFGGYLSKMDPSNPAAVQDSIRAAAALMNLDFVAAGVTTTPIDVSVVENETAREELRSLLKMLNVRLAAGILTSGASGTGKKVLKDWEIAQTTMKRIVSGALELPVPYTRTRELVRR